MPIPRKMPRMDLPAAVVVADYAVVAAAVVAAAAVVVAVEAPGPPGPFRTVPLLN